MEAQGLLDPCKKMERTIKYWTQVQEIESELQLCCCQLWSVEKVTTLLKSLILFSLKLLPLEACAVPVTEKAPSNWQLTLSTTYLQVRKLTYSFSIFFPKGCSRDLCYRCRLFYSQPTEFTFMDRNQRLPPSDLDR